MGANGSKSGILGKPARQLVPSTAFTCTNDEDCKNIDSTSSSIEKGVVYSCPSATCNAGQCSCGSECKLDKYSGVCCQGLMKIGDITFCVENTSPPTERPSTRPFFTDPGYYGQGFAPEVIVDKGVYITEAEQNRRSKALAKNQATMAPEAMDGYVFETFASTLQKRKNVKF